MASPLKPFSILGIVAAPIVAFGAAERPVFSATVIDTVGTGLIFGTDPLTSVPFSKDGFTLVFSNPKSPNPTAVSRTVDATASSLPGGGTCLGGSRNAVGSAICGNPPGTPFPQLNSIDLNFNRDLLVTGFTIKARSDTEDLTTFNRAESTWSSGFGSPTVFTFEVDETTAEQVGLFRINTYKSSFAPIFVSASSPLTVTSLFYTPPAPSSVFSAQALPLAPAGYMDYWIESITVKDVPGPLPLLGLGAAFTWSRRLRRKTSIR